MSYTLDGRFDLNKKLDEPTYEFLNNLAKTRRMKRMIEPSFGVEGEFYVNGNDYDSNIMDKNKTPKTQPSLYCPWVPTKDRLGIEWDKKEKASEPIKWIEYIISKVLAPKGYVLSGEVEYWDDSFYRKNTDYVEVVDNVVNGKRLIVDYSINKLLPIRGASKHLPRTHSNTLPDCSVHSLPKIRQVNSKRSAAVATATHKQTAKEKREEQTRQLEAKVLLLEDQLLQKDREIKRARHTVQTPKKLTVQEMMLDKLRVDAKFGGSLDDFKLFLENLLA